MGIPLNTYAHRGGGFNPMMNSGPPFMQQWNSKFRTNGLNPPLCPAFPGPPPPPPFPPPPPPPPPQQPQYPPPQPQQPQPSMCPGPNFRQHATPAPPFHTSNYVDNFLPPPYPPFQQSFSQHEFHQPFSQSTEMNYPCSSPPSQFPMKINFPSYPCPPPRAPPPPKPPCPVFSHPLPPPPPPPPPPECPIMPPPGYCFMWAMPYSADAGQNGGYPAQTCPLVQPCAAPNQANYGPSNGAGPSFGETCGSWQPGGGPFPPRGPSFSTPVCISSIACAPGAAPCADDCNPPVEAQRSFTSPPHWTPSSTCAAGQALQNAFRGNNGSNGSKGRWRSLTQ